MSFSSVYNKGARIIFGKGSFLFKRHGGDMLIFGGLGLLATSTVLSGIGAVKAVEVHNDYKEEVSKIDEMNIPDEEKRHLKDKATYRCAWRMFKCFAPAVTCGVTGGTFVLCGRNVWKKRYAGASALAALYNETLDKYRERMQDEIGEEKEREIYEDVQTVTHFESDEKGKTKTTEVKTPAGSGHPLEFIFDERNLKYKKYAGNNWFALMQARKQCNNILNARGWMLLSEVLEIIGMPVPSYAAQVGWVRDPGNPEKIKFGMEGDDELRYATNQCVLLKFNCDGDIFSQIDVIEMNKYGYRCDIA